MHLELSKKEPGFTTVFILVPKESVPEVNLFEKMLFGQESQFEEIPISTYREDNGVLWYTPFDSQYEQKFSDSNYLISERTYILGTDSFGRDLLSRILCGTRVSLSVGFISVFISLLIGISLGAIAGYYRGRVDAAIMWLVNVVWSIPTLLMVIAISLALGKGFWQVFVAVGLTMWVEVARIVRGEVLSVRENEYVEAAKTLGFSHFRILFKHILPNVMGAVIVISAANFASAILIEAGLSFLGIGAQPPMPSWGTMIKDHYAFIVMGKSYLAIFPGIAIMLLVLSFVLLGNALRDALDVRS
jgi:peptide/nickel transport system permease protein